MPIPESQLETWAAQGATVTAKATHESVRNALVAYTSPIRDRVNNGEVEIYLQGSYKNDTNIRGDSDVDLVVQLNTTFRHDLTELLDSEKTRFHQVYPVNATYRWADFRLDVLKGLRAYYGERQVEEGNNCLNVLPSSGRLPCDVLACIEYRKYTHFFDTYKNHVEGIVFYTRKEGREVINFPKAHYDNGVTKNSAAHTNGWFKPSVRIFKNARTYMIDKKMISDDLAPSYFLQCLIYNVPDYCFGNSYQTTYQAVVAWLASANISGFICQNGEVPLFGNTPEQWSEDEARTFISALALLWQNWQTTSYAPLRYRF